MVIVLGAHLTLSESHADRQGAKSIGPKLPAALDGPWALWSSEVIKGVKVSEQSKVFYMVANTCTFRSGNNARGPPK